MSIDRRIVSILYYNNITEVEKVEKFLGENNGYYNIIINGELKKLKIPGREYSENIKKGKKQKIQKLEPLNNLDEIAQKIEEDSKELFTIKTEVKIVSFDEELENSEKEKQKILEKLPDIKPKKEAKPKQPKISNKKIEIVESKKIDDDLDDFLTTI